MYIPCTNTTVTSYIHTSLLKMILIVGIEYVKLHPPDQSHLHRRYPFQRYCALIVDSYGDNAETINLSVTNNLSEKTENDWVKENTPHMTFHEMSHEDRVLLYSGCVFVKTKRAQSFVSVSVEIAIIGRLIYRYYFPVKWNVGVKEGRMLSVSSSHLWWARFYPFNWHGGSGWEISAHGRFHIEVFVSLYQSVRFRFQG